MAQVITPELEALVVSKLQVGADKPRGEIEIDYVVPGSTAIGATVDLLALYGSISNDPGNTGNWAPQPSGTLKGCITDGTGTSVYVPWTSGTWVHRLICDLGAEAIVDHMWAKYQDGGPGIPNQPEYSDDGTAWTTAPGSWAAATDATHVGGSWRKYTITGGPLTHRYWRFNKVGSGIHVEVDLFEWQIVGESISEISPAHETVVVPVASLTIDRNRKMAAAQLDVTLSNEQGAAGWYTGNGRVFIPNNPIRAYAWLGDRTNRVQIYTGLIDRPHEHRNPKTVSLKARSRMKWLIEQRFVPTDPQGADEPGADRTEENGVYLGKSPEYIVGDILDRAGWPAADRVIASTGITLAEYIVAEGSWLDAIVGADRLTTVTGFDFIEDELGIARFEPSPLIASSEPDPDWEFAAGVNVMALDHQADDEERVTRVLARGPMTSAIPKWSEVWRTSVVKYPVGAWYDPAEPDYIRVIDRVTKYLYKIRQSDRKIVAKKYIGGYPLGLSGIPGDTDHYLVLHARWIATSSEAATIQKRQKSDHAVVGSWALPDGKWSGMKSDGSNIYLTNYGDGKLYKRTMTAGAVSSGTITVDGDVQDQPTGLWINGTTIGVFFADNKRFILTDTSAPYTVTGRQSTKGTWLAGGEADTDTDEHLYGVAGAGQMGLTTGLVAKFALVELVETDVSRISVDYDLEDALGFQSGIADRAHPGCPNSDDPHPYEARWAVFDLEVVQSPEQAQGFADAQLALLSRLRRAMDLATLGHPGIQLNDVARYLDAPAGIDAPWVIDSYRVALGQTYTQTMSVLPWEAP